MNIHCLSYVCTLQSGCVCRCCDCAKAALAAPCPTCGSCPTCGKPSYNGVYFCYKCFNSHYLGYVCPVQILQPAVPYYAGWWCGKCGYTHPYEQVCPYSYIYTQMPTIISGSGTYISNSFQLTYNNGEWINANGDSLQNNYNTNQMS